MQEILQTLISEQDCDKRIKTLADQITNDYTGKAPHIIGILKGGAYFFTELTKRVLLPITLDFMCVSSYGNTMHSAGNITIKQDLTLPIDGKDVIIVEDIIDSGHTMHNLLPYLSARGANSVKLAALLSKPSRRETNVSVDYLGFEIPDKFVVGYGLDYAEKYRNLPYIAYVELLD